MKGELEVYSNGIVHCSVCTNIKDKKRIELLVNQKNPTGTHGFWHIDTERKTFADKNPNPCLCEKKSKTHKHYLMVC